MPQTNRLDFAGTLKTDTVTFQISNLVGEDVSNFYVASHTDFEIAHIAVYVDGVYQEVLQTEIEKGTVYPGKFTTRWIIPSFTEDVVIRFHTMNASAQEYTFCGSKSFPFFADVYSTAEPCCNNFRGNINGDAIDIIDISDLVYFVNFSFGTPSGPPPPCFDEADVNGDTQLDIADLVRLVTYMFANGPQPNPCE